MAKGQPLPPGSPLQLRGLPPFLARIGTPPLDLIALLVGHSILG